MLKVFLIKALVLGLATIVAGDKHRLCACESGRGDGVDDQRSQYVVQNAPQPGQWVFSFKYWTKAHGATHEGHYFHAIDGEISNSDESASDDGWLGGDEINGRCPEHSTCFTPTFGDYKNCGNDADGGCTSAWGKVNGDGTVKKG